jgi:hypothetical protein
MIDPATDEQSPGTSSSSPLVRGENERPDILDAIEGLRIKNGEDLPESSVPALYATATGSSLSWAGGMTPPQSSCPGGTTGYPCFREEALPIVVLVSDADFHNGPDGQDPYSFSEAPTYATALAELDDIGARVVGIYSGPGPDFPGLDDFRRLAMDTRTTYPDGSPMVFQIGEDGSGLSTSVVDGIASLAGGRTQDVHGQAVAGGSHPAGADPLSVVTGLVTGEATAYASKDATTFYALEAGSDFELVLSLAGRAPAGDEAEALVVRVRAVDAEGATFATRRVIVVLTPPGRTLNVISP